MNLLFLKAKQYRDQAIMMTGMAIREPDESRRVLMLSIAELFSRLHDKLVELNTPTPSDNVVRFKR